MYLYTHVNLHSTCIINCTLAWADVNLLVFANMIIRRPSNGEAKNASML